MLKSLFPPTQLPGYPGMLKSSHPWYSCTLFLLHGFSGNHLRHFPAFYNPDFFFIAAEQFQQEFIPAREFEFDKMCLSSQGTGGNHHDTAAFIRQDQIFPSFVTLKGYGFVVGISPG
eukprot:2819283-Rhodomonas_salina.1